jgi:8-oxo-dGTP pyrophosphatase MutT (NUDIX family)
MPSVSSAQHNAMEAAAHGHSTLGIPENVGKEFVKADAADPTKAAGIMFKAGEQVLFLKRGDGGDFPGYWGFPGGHTEPGETSEDTATRETIEEIGLLPDGVRTLLSRRNGPLPGAMPPYDHPVDFTTYLHEIPETFEPEVSGEHTGYAWARVDQPPEPLHPGCAVALKMLTANELDIARLIAAGDLTSPQTYKNVTLFAIRITGTGSAYRGGDLDEYAWRDPADYLNDDFLARCNGLPVIFEHPKTGKLNSDEFADRVVGTIMLSYIKGDEVWGIAKMYDAAAIELMKNEVLSTSPMVVVSNGNDFIPIDDGTKLLIEGKPLLLDHIAICERGVWDKGGEPAGIVSDITDQEAASMANPEDKEPATKADADEGVLAKVAERLDSLCSRMDAWEAEKKEKADAEKAKADAEAEEAEKAKADAEDDDKKEKALADTEALKADMNARMDEMAGKIPRDLTDEEAAAMADAQSKADSVFSALGMTTPRPSFGETALAYRRRTLKAIQEHSPDWSDKDLSKMDAELLPIAEKQIRADALAFANSPRSAPEGSLRAVHTKSPAGHQIISYVGDIGVTFAPFRGQSRAMRIKTQSELRGH